MTDFMLKNGKKKLQGIVRNNMKGGFTTRLIEEKGNSKLIVHGTNKVHCSGCTKELEPGEYIYTCQDAMMLEDKPEYEFRDIHCLKCWYKPTFYCDKATVNHAGGQHADIKATLLICPAETNILEYIMELGT